MTVGSSLNVLIVQSKLEDQVNYHHFLQQDSLYTYQLRQLSATAALQQQRLQPLADVILLDLDLPTGEGIALLKHFRQQWKTQTAIIALAEAEDVETAVTAMKSGAQDYLVKQKLTSERLHNAIHQAVEELQLTQQSEPSQVSAPLQGQAALTASTEQQASLAAQNSQDFETELQSLFAVMDDVILILDRKGTYLKNISTNPKNLCRPTQEFLGRSLREFFSAEQADLFLNCIQQTLITGQTQEYEYSLIINNVERWFDAKCSALTAETVLWVARDISDRKQAEAALQQSELTNRIIIETLPDLLIQMDREGHYSHVLGGGAVRVKHPSSACSEPELHCVLSPELAEQRLYYTHQAIESGSLQVYEQIFDFGGDQRYEEVRIAPLNSQEVLVIIRDITDRKRAEIALHRLVESTASVTGKDFFSTLAQQLMLTLKVQCVMVSKLLGDRLQTLAYWLDGESQPNVTIALVDVPCCAVAIEQGYLHYPKGLQQHFSEYPLVQALQIDSYLGVVLANTKGQRLGNLCIMDTKPMEDVRWAEAVLRVFATRAAAELERQQATEALEELNQKLEGRVEQRTVALQNEEAKLSAIFNQAAVGMDLAALDGQYLKVNQKLCDILGYTQEELLTENIKDVSHPEDVNKGNAERQQLYAGAIDSFSLEKRCRRKDGSTVWINLTVSLVHKPSGEPDYSIGVVQDISERARLEAQREQAEDSLRQSEEKFRQLAENIQSVFWISNADCSEIIYVSPAYEVIWGRSCKSLYDSPASFAEAIYPEDQAHVFELLATQSQGYDQEYRILRPDGLIRWVRDRAFPIYNEQGEVYRLAGIAEDITARKQTEETLTQQLAAIEAATDGIAILNRDGEYTYLNEAHVKLFGYKSAEDLLGKTWRDLYSPSEVRRFESWVFPELMRRRAWRGDAIATRQDGSTFAQEVSLTLSLDGEIICVCRDISERARMEVERRQTEQALQQSEEQFRTVFDHAPIAISLARVDNYQIFRVNAAHHQLFGYSNEELATLSFADFAHPDDVEKNVEQVKRMVRGEIPGFQIEQRFIKKNGDVILANMTVALIRDREGHPLYSMAMIEDITERKQAEMEIIRNRDLREAIFNESTDAIFLVDVDTRSIIDCNRRAVELFEAFSKENLINLESNSLQRYKSSEKELQVISQEIREKGFWSGEIEYITHQGNLFWGNLVAKPISIAGRVMNLVQVTDISKRKQSEMLLKAQQKFLRRLIDTVPNLIFVKDWEGRFTLVNQATANVYNSTIEDLVGKTDADFNPDVAEVERFQAVDREVMTTLQTKVLEETVTSPTGRQRYFQTIKSPLLSADGHSREILGVATDISDRKEMEEQLRRSEAHLLEAQHIAHVGSWQFDVTTRRITWSAETFRMFGYDPAQQEPTYEELTQVVHPADRSNYTAVFQEAIEQVKSFELEHRVLQQDGSVSYVLAKGQPILDNAGKLLSFLGTALDITDRKQFEEQLRQTNDQLAHTNMELARATRLKDEFLANMSHELRTPLNAVLGLTEGLLEAVFGEMNHKQIKALKTIERSGAHLLALINDILDIAKIESGHVELDLVPTAVAPLCRSSLAFIKQQALKKRIQIEIKLPTDLPNLMVDERRIRQVLLNLLNNAVKFTPEKGVITLEASSSPQQILATTVLSPSNLR
ncbi:MAG TPA: PAS domain S-box protein, partial [Leptolyngbyaceae cyanobacterium]